MKSFPLKSKLLLILLLTNLLTLSVYSQKKENQQKHIENRTRINVLKDVPFKQRLANGGINLKGDISMIANSIVSKHQNGTVSNDNYSGSESNGLINMEYIDVDTDATTFSSSSSKLSLPSCSKVVYAGLYWSAVYPKERWGETALRSDDFNKIKFKLPGGNYQDLTGEIVYDDGEPESKPYLCYKDVTSIVSDLNSPNGDYFAANIRATVGKDNRGLGSSGGWVMVVIYKDNTQPSRRISLFDGFSSIGNGATVDVSYSGFTTIPVGPVKSRMLVAALEGDKSIPGDRFQIKDTDGNYQNLFTTNLNPKGNFFNGSITIDDAYLNGRNPNSENTLGFDVDLFNLNNVNNKIIKNGQSQADIRLTSAGDVYWVFLNAMSIDIIEPDIELVKTIDDGIGNNIAGAAVDLGDLIWYNVAFQNKGNDDALNTVLTDRLPKNVDLLESDLSVPPGVTYTYVPPSQANEFRGLLTFTIPDGLVEKGDPIYNIRIKVKVVEDCNQLRDVCSNRVANQAFVSYKGKTSGIVINENPSFSGVDSCDNGAVGPSNFLVDVDGCKYERDEILCTNSVVLTAGNGFISYEWKNETGAIIGTNQSITVTEIGKYTVSKVAPVGCISTSEIINVVYFNTQPNPLFPFADDIKICPNDGSKLSEIYLCGNGSIREITTNFSAETTVVWQKLDETSCAAVANTDCANVNNSCTWNTINTGNNFSASDAGQYRLEIRSEGGCFKRFYFNVFKANLNPQIITKNINCGTPGSITINNVPAGYEYSLTNTPGSYQDSNMFSISAAGNYGVFVRRKGASSSSCVYTLPTVDILEKSIDVKLITQKITCSDSEGEIRIQVNNVDGPFTYQLYKNSSLIATQAAEASNDFIFKVSETGVYTVKVSTPDNCTFSGDVTFTKPDPLIINAVTTKDINCGDGEIQLNSGGGTLTHNYAIWSYNGTNLYSSSTAIPLSDFFTDTTVEIPRGKEGTYQFIVVDGNNCFSISDSVTISLEPELAFIDIVNNVICASETNGNVQVSVDGSSLGYAIEYSIDNGVNYQSTGVFNNLGKGNYTIKIKATKSGNTCIYSRDVVVSEPEKLEATASLTKDYTCNSAGEITFSTPTGGVGPYKFSIDNSNFFTTKVFENLTNGTYLPTVKDANNCVVTLANITIDELPVTPIFTPTITYNCDGSGKVTMLPTSALYTFSLDGGTYISNNVFDNLSVGNHTVSINYGKECLATTTVTILSNKEFSGTLTNVSDVVCNGTSTGSITINADNYSGSYQYSINEGAWISTSVNPVVVNNLPKGTHSVKIKSSTCIVDLGNITISEPDLLSVSATITTPLTCLNTGANITPTAVGGTAPYVFSIDNGITWKTTFVDIPAGNYTVKVKDSNDCIATSTTSIEVNAPIAIEYSAISTRCYNGSNGEITVNVTQGNGSYLFSINNGPWFSSALATPDSYTFNNLTPNTYTVKVKDAFGCETTASSHTINQQINADVILENISCNAGKITVNPTGGDGNFVYAFVNSGASVSSSDFNSANSKSITVIGDYDVYVRDNSGNTDYCEYKKTVSIAKTPELIVATTEVSPKCFNEKGNVKLDIAGGLAPYNIEVTGPSSFSDITTDFFGTTKEYSNLLSGTYTIKVTGKDNCIKTTTATIVNAKELKANLKPILPTCGETDPSKYGFEFEVTENYTPYTLEFSADNGANWTTNPIFKGIISGTKVYPVIRILETDGTTIRCLKVLEPYTIPFQVTSLIVSSIPGGNCTDGFNVSVEAKDGIGPYQFAVNSTTVWQSPTPVNATNHVFNNLIPGLSYTFYVKDATGCIKQNQTDIYDTYTPDVIISGAVTNNACATSNNGEVTFTINDPSNNLTGVITWELFDKATNTVLQTGSQTGLAPVVVSNLAAGDYYLVAKNTGLCAWGSLDVTVKKGIAISGDAIKVRDITCSLPGIIKINTIIGGFSPYQYTLTSSNFINPIVSSDASIEVPYSNLVDATISSTIAIAVSDSSSCGASLGSVVLEVSELPEIDSVTVNNCDANKSISVTSSKGKAPYFYSIDGGVSYQSNNLFENLNPNTYTVIVKDSNGCDSAPNSVKIIPNLDFEVLITKSLDCSVSPNAEISINVTSGSGNYDYEIKNSANMVVFPRASLDVNPKKISLPNSDTYTVIVYDNDTSTLNCFKSVEIIIKDSITPNFTSSITNSVCSGSNSGTIKLVNGTNAISFTYSLSPVSGTFDAASNSFINVSPGIYAITALGSNGCSVVKTNQEIKEFQPIVIPTPVVSEFGCFVGNSANNASITIDKTNIIGGSGTYSIIEFVNNKGTATTTDDVVVQSGTNPVFISNDKNGGNYTINVYDNSNCLGSTNAIIKPFGELSNVLITIDKLIDCATGENISITYSSSSSIANVSFQVIGEKGFTQTNNTGVFTNLPEDTYQINVKNVETNCEVTATHVVNMPNQFQLEINKLNDVNCFASSTGTVTVNFSSATPYSGAYNYVVYNNTTGVSTSISGNATGITTINNLPKGEYYVNVNMENSPFCAVKSSIFTIESPVKSLDFTVTPSLISCEDSNSGKVVVNAEGGWGNYQYQVATTSGTNIQPFSTNSVIENLVADTYVVTVKDDKGCEVTKNITLNNPTPINATVTETTAILCKGDSTSVITVSLPTGGQGTPPSYQYQLIHSNGTISAKQTSNVFTGLSAGDYSVIISDEFTCDLTLPITIKEPTKVTTAVEIISNLTCTVSTADVKVTASGGAGDYMYSIDGVNFTLNNTFSVGEGEHVFYAKDKEGCISESSTIVTISKVEPLAAVLNTDSATITCAGDNNAVLSANASGGLGNYEYELLDAVDTVISVKQTSNTFTNLAAGVYKIRVTSLDCITVTDPYTIIDPNPLVLVAPIVVSNISCFEEIDGSISINATGGTGNLKYSIDQVKFVNTNTFTGLSAGSYIVTVQDERGCFISETVEIKAPNKLTATIVNVQEETCFESGNGSFSVNISGGTAPFQTKINGSDYVENQVDFTNLSGGKTYVVYVKDKNDCETIVSVSLREAIDLKFTIETSVSCPIYKSTITATVEDSLKNDVTFTLNDSQTQNSGVFENLDSGDYKVTVNHISGCTISKNITITNPKPLLFSEVLDVEDVTCNGANNGNITINAFGGIGNLLYSIDDGVTFKSDNSFSNLSAGTYKVIVKDELNCPISQEVVISQPKELKATVFNLTEKVCVNDKAITSFKVKIEGGKAPYKTRIGNEPYKDSQLSFSNLSIGNHIVSVKDKNNCVVNLTVTINKPIELKLAVSYTTNCNGLNSISATINEEYINDDIEYTINGNNAQSNGVFHNLSAGKYIIQAKHFKGCIDTKEIEIEEVNPLSLSVDSDTLNKLIVNGEGGFAPYTYSIDGENYEFDNTFTIGETKTYTIYVKDSLGCIVSKNIIGEYITIIIPNFFTPNKDGQNDFWYPEKVQPYHNAKIFIYDRYSRLLKTFKGVNRGWDGNYNNAPLPSGDYWYVIHYNEILGEPKKLIGNFTLYR